MKVLAMGSQVIFKSFSVDPFGSYCKSLLSSRIADPATKNNIISSIKEIYYLIRAVNTEMPYTLQGRGTDMGMVPDVSSSLKQDLPGV